MFLYIKDRETTATLQSWDSYGTCLKCNQQNIINAFSREEHNYRSTNISIIKNTKKYNNSTYLFIGLKYQFMLFYWTHLNFSLFVLATAGYCEGS